MTVCPPSQTELCHRWSTRQQCVYIFVVNLPLEPLKNLCPEASPPMRLVCSKISQNVCKKRDGDVEIYEKTRVFGRTSLSRCSSDPFVLTAGLLSWPPGWTPEPPPTWSPASQRASLPPCVFFKLGRFPSRRHGMVSPRRLSVKKENWPKYKNIISFQKSKKKKKKQ